MIETTTIGCAGDTLDYIKVTSDGFFLYIKNIIDYDNIDRAVLDAKGVQELIDVLIEWQRLTQK